MTHFDPQNERIETWAHRASNQIHESGKRMDNHSQALQFAYILIVAFIIATYFTFKNTSERLLKLEQTGTAAVHSGG
jgi:Na+/melibiose symporter-like transporter